MSDRKIIIIIIALILLYLLVWITGTMAHRLVYYFSFVNLLSALSLLIYWVQKQIRITQHIFEQREIFVLCLEIIAVGTSVYVLQTGTNNGWLKMTTYLFFGLHLSALIIGLIFLLVFKMKKLI